VTKLEHGIISCIGNTPLVRLNKVIEADFCLYAKLEGFNPSGSLKDRPALEIVRHGIESGKINQNTVVIEASSGNMGLDWLRFTVTWDCVLYASLIRKLHPRISSF